MSRSTRSAHQNTDLKEKAALAVLKDNSFSLKAIVDDMFLVLSEKEKDVITKRFSLNNKPRQTLDKIGKHYSVTRERIRQIEYIALNKLKRTVINTKLRLVNRLAKKYIKEQGGVMLEKEIINKLLNSVYTTSQVDGSIIALTLNCEPDLKKVPKSFHTEAYWRLKEVTVNEVKKVANAGVNALKNHSEVMSDEQVVSAVKNISSFKKNSVIGEMIFSCLKIDKRARKVDGKWGLMEWRHINPRSIHDKAIIVLKKSKKPLHFVEIANRIAETGFDKKVVTVQAVHNELIRYSEFVLVGRGLYALSTWGYEKGTVSDVIERFLKKNGPTPKKDIVDYVLKQRDVQVGTISLNLQKNPSFVRVGRAVYDYQAKKK
jgi:DNA-directed RNA polymerase delta subunit